MTAHYEIEETIDEYLSKVSIGESRRLFQSVNEARTVLSGRAVHLRFFETAHNFY
jgi:hypothetical protein